MTFKAAYWIRIPQHILVIENGLSRVDYVIAHCMSGSLQNDLEKYYQFSGRHFATDVLTDFFDEIEKELKFKKFYCGHYHEELELDAFHTIIYEKIMPVDSLR